jgi:hypothetical protein
MPREKNNLRGVAYVIATLSILAICNSQSVAQTVSWTNLQTGPTAGDWSNPANWDLGVVPGPLNTAEIANGGEARITSNVSASRIEVGKNGGAGFLTSTAPGIDISMRVDFDTGETGSNVASGPITVNSNGTTTIANAASIVIGTTGSGELDVGQANATFGATANSTGVFSVTNIPLVQIADNAEIGQASGTATANGNGTVVANSIGTFDVGKFFNVAVASNSNGVRNATGEFNSSFMNLLMVNDDFAVGQAFSAGNQGTSNASSNIADAGTLDIGANLQVGVAIAKGGGTSQATGNLNIERTTSLQIGEEFNIGRVSSETSGLAGTPISGQADTITSSATLTQVDDISAGSGIFVGRASTRDNSVGSANGTLTIDTANSITVGVGLDVGQTGSAGVATNAGVITSGTGSATFRNVTGTVGISGDIDVGSTGSTANTTTFGNGTLWVENVGELNISIDLDLGQVSGAGQSTGIGFATIRSVPNVTIGDDIDVGIASGSAGGTHSGSGTLVVSDSTVSIGLVDPLAPGSLHLGNASPTLGKRAQGQGAATFERSTVSVGRNITVGKLSGGSTDLSNSSQGTLNLLDSSISATALEVATLLDATAGTVDGTLHLDSSLVTISGTMALGPNSLLEFGLGGTTKADGTGASGQFSAIDATLATLDGDLNVFLVDGFLPSAGDSFQIISGPLTGSLNPVGFPVLSGGLGWDVRYNPNSVIVLAFFTADFDTDGNVDGDDLTDWQTSYGIGAGADADADGDSDGADFLAWQHQFGSGMPLLASSQSIPEPTAGLLCFTALAILACKRFRLEESFWRERNWEGIEQ